MLGAGQFVIVSPTPAAIFATKASLPPAFVGWCAPGTARSVELVVRPTYVSPSASRAIADAWSVPLPARSEQTARSEFARSNSAANAWSPA